MHLFVYLLWKVCVLQLNSVSIHFKGKLKSSVSVNGMKGRSEQKSGLDNTCFYMSMSIMAVTKEIETLGRRFVGAYQAEICYKNISNEFRLHQMLANCVLLENIKHHRYLV